MLQDEITLPPIAFLYVQYLFPDLNSGEPFGLRALPRGFPNSYL